MAHTLAWIAQKFRRTPGNYWRTTMSVRSHRYSNKVVVSIVPSLAKETLILTLLSFDTGLSVKPPSISVHASKTASLPHNHTSADQDSAVRLAQPSGGEDRKKLKRRLRIDTLLQGKNRRKKLSESDDRSWCGRSISSASRDSTPSLSSTDSRFLASTCTSSDFVPVRQCERRIRAKILQNAVLDDDLGIGIGDDENQKRSWHKPRVCNKEVVQHRCSQGRILLQVRQASGDLEWLEQSTVEESLVERYKAERLKLGEQLIAPGRKPNRPSSATAGPGRRPGRPGKQKANEGWISVLVGPDDQHSPKGASVPSSYAATSSSSSLDSEWESEISF
ncbi:hypothetical protein RvY_13892 [Ramazzottius varieornatus]|uniref:Uncharacterized protein n=1 Tax=Ramazzottius varieornatus TaxID=947166 RepID=A0A1D1VTE4_RAMVA|nr:hypothetical protein RvY_13892 [Ramazzottius varieornatus]